MIREIIEKLVTQYKQKNIAYGSSAHETYLNFGGVSYAIRIHDKLKRYEQLTANPDIPFADEAIEDTLGDAVTYIAMFATDLVHTMMHDDTVTHMDGTIDLMYLLGSNTDEEIAEMAKQFKRDVVAERSLPETVVGMWHVNSTPTDYVMLCAYILNLLNERMMNIEQRH